MKNCKISVIISILFIGFFLRFYGSWFPFVDDTPDWIRIANDISLKKSNFHIPFFGSYHGPMTAYLLKLSSLIFGENMVGWRMMSISSSVFHLFVIYLFVRKGLTENEAILTMILSASNVFLIWQAFYSIQEEFLLLFSTLLLFNFWMAITTKKGIYMLFAGIFMGLGLLTKEVILLLGLPLSLSLLISKENRDWFKRKEFYGAIAISIFIAIPYIWWDYQHQWLHLRRIVFKEFSHNKICLFHLSPSIIYLYLGVILSKLPFSSLSFWRTPQILKDTSLPFNAEYGIQYMNPLMGILALAGVIFYLRKKEPFIRFLILIIASIVIVSIFLVKAEPRVYSIIIVPSLALAAKLIFNIFKKGVIGRIAVIFLMLLFIFDALHYTLNIDKLIYMKSLLLIKQGDTEKLMSLNDLSKAFINKIESYQPTLVIFPDSRMDSLANYFTSYSKIKTIDCLPENKYLYYNEKDLEKILVFITSFDIEQNQYLKWAEDNNYLTKIVKNDVIAIKNKNDINLPISILFFSRIPGSNLRPDSIRKLISMSNP